MDNHAEGWGVLLPGHRAEHYYRGGYSICGNSGYEYKGILAPDSAQPPGPDDCGQCRRKLTAEQKHAAKRELIARRT